MNLSGIRPGDIVEIDGLRAMAAEPASHTGRYYAMVVDNPGGELRVKRIDRAYRSGYERFNVRPRLVIGHWRMSKATANRKDGVLV